MSSKTPKWMQCLFSKTINRTMTEAWSCKMCQVEKMHMKLMDRKSGVVTVIVKSDCYLMMSAKMFVFDQ